MRKKAIKKAFEIKKNKKNNKYTKQKNITRWQEPYLRVS